MEIVRVKYLRKDNKKPYGAMVCINEDGKIKFGWSLCSKCDKFVKKTAITMALTKNLNTPPPMSIEKQYDEFVFSQHKHLTNLFE